MPKTTKTAIVTGKPQNINATLPLSLQRWVPGWFQQVLALGIHTAEGWGLVIGANEERVKAWATFVDDSLPLCLIDPNALYGVVAILRDRYSSLANNCLSEWDSKIAKERTLANYWLYRRMDDLTMAIEALPVQEQDAVIGVGIEEAHNRTLGKDTKVVRLRKALYKACKEIEYLLELSGRRPGEILRACREELEEEPV